MVISHRVQKSKPSFENLTSAYHPFCLRLVLRLELRLLACRNGADLSKLHGFEERRFLRVRGNLRAEVVLRIPGPAGALAANDFGMYCKKRTHTCIPCAASCAARHYRWRAGGEALSEPLLPFHGGFTLLPLGLVALATGWAGLGWAD